MTSFLNKLTIILPTKDRPDWLKRVLLYYSQNNFSGKILLLDSSEEYIFKKIKVLINNFNNLNINLRSMPNMNCEKSIYNASNLIDTEYSIFLADDDILLVGGLEKSLEFLEMNKNYIGAIGNGYMISTINNGPFGKINNIKKYDLNGYEDEDSFLRIKNFLNNIKNTSFTIIRSNFFISGYKKIMKIDDYYQSHLFGELIQSLFYIYNGRIKKINVDYLVRQSHPGNTYSKLNKRPINQVKWDSSYKILTNLIKNFFDLEKKNELCQIINDLLNDYLKKKEIRINENTFIQLLKKITIIKNTFKVFRYMIKDYKMIKKYEKNNNLLNYFKIVELK